MEKVHKLYITQLYIPLGILIKYKTTVTRNDVNMFYWDSTFRLGFSHHELSSVIISHH